MAEELLGEINHMNKKKIFLIHRNLGAFDYYFPFILTNQLYEYHFYIYDLEIWYQLKNSKEISRLINEFKVSIYFHIGSIKSNNLKIDNKILISFIEHVIIPLRLHIIRYLKKLINFLFIGIPIRDTKKTKKIRYKGLEDYDILFEWSKLNYVGENLLINLKSINKKITLIPDAPYCDTIYTWPLSDVTNDMNIEFNVTHENNRDYLVKNFNISKNKIKLLPDHIKNEKFKSKFLYISNSFAKKGNIKICYFCQKNYNLSERGEIDYISIAEHKQNIRRIFNYLSIYSHKCNFTFYLKIHPKKFVLDSKWLKDLSKEFKIRIIIVKNSSVWPLILNADVIFTEFTSAFISSTVKENTFMIQNKTFEYYFNNDIGVNDSYKDFTDTKIHLIDCLSEKMDYYFLNN